MQVPHLSSCWRKDLEKLQGKTDLLDVSCINWEETINI